MPDDTPSMTWLERSIVNEKDYAIVRLNNWMDGDINISLKMEFIEEATARSEFNLYVR